MDVERGLEKTALSTLERYRMLEGGDTVVVAVSGGPDSVALLLLLHGLAPRMRLDLHVFHLDHMLRGHESAEDARFVEELSRELGLPVRSLAVDVRHEVGLAGRSPQDAARQVRLSRLRDFADEVAADRIATGHTADDQVETFLMRAVQGAGLSGLGGIPPVSGRLIRPLIEVWRFQVEEYCDATGVAPRQDMSNLRMSYLRNRVRLSLLPFLASEFGPSIKEVILREAESLSLDRDFMAEQVSRAFDLTGREPGDEVRLNIPRLLSLHPALQRGVIRKAWSRAMPGEPSLSWRHVLDVLEKVAGGGTGARLDLPGPLVAEREYDELVFRPPEGETAHLPSSLAVPGAVDLGWAGVSIEARRVGRDKVELGSDPMVEFVSAELEAVLEVRAPAPGDRFRPLGSAGSRKLKDFFIDAKVPRAGRKRCPVVLSGGEVVWVAGHRIDERFRLEDEADEAVMLIMRPLDDYDLAGARGSAPRKRRNRVGSPRHGMTRVEGKLAELEIEETLYTEERIKDRVSELAQKISEDYRGSSCLMIGILKGAFIFLADLARQIEVPVEFDFIACSSYGSATKTSGVVRILKDLDTDIRDRHVLLVEDIIDTGLTLRYLLRNFRSRGPASLEICALLNKRVENQVDLPIKYEGFSIPDVFVVGYGLDYAERYRNLPYIAKLKK